MKEYYLTLTEKGGGGICPINFTEDQPTKDKLWDWYLEMVRSLTEYNEKHHKDK